MQCIQVQYFSLFILASILGNNIFLNLIMVGSGETLAGFVSGYLLANFKDTRVFQSFALTSALCNALFYMVPSGAPQFICFLLSVFGVAGR